MRTVTLTQILRNTTSNGTCLEYHATKPNMGYPTAGAVPGTTKPERAHRRVYRLVHGHIPECAVIHHTCHNKLCVNPTHLKAILGGHKEHSHIHNPRGETCKRGHPREGNTYAKPSGGIVCRQCDKERNRRNRAMLSPPPATTPSVPDLDREPDNAEQLAAPSEG